MNKWEGGEQPVSGITRVNYRLRDGTKMAARQAGELAWEHVGEGFDIVEWEHASPLAQAGLADSAEVLTFGSLMPKTFARGAVGLDAVNPDNMFIDQRNGSIRAVETNVTPIMRGFATGAVRSNDAGKPDYEGFLSPLVVERFGRYMTEHQKQADGQMRASDNWQKGIPLDAYIKSGWRHFFDLWKAHRGHFIEYGLEETICALMFNVMGYLHEHLKAKALKEAA